eukprot:NODE_18655_length_882_cov_9.311258.p1 GENE.NODE_18655_length_882_cov_9.311258~~NODE_18655_length_882_cov_9.311258.p1  ORF type:complete len:179 (-),score=19.60 NODE_18655_length_882_cov_9.311258:213-749(-)
MNSSILRIVDAAAPERVPHITPNTHILWGALEPMSSASGSDERDVRLDNAIETLSSDSSTIRSPADAHSRITTDGHANGTCIPCRFFSTAGGCRRAQGCKFCHEWHDNLMPRPRPSKTTRVKLKRLVNATPQDIGPELDSPAEGGAQSVRDRYLRDLMRVRRRELAALAGNVNPVCSS